MAGRIRSLRPELLDDEVMASLSSDAWRIAVSVVLLADDFGAVRWSPRYIAANVFQDTGRDVVAAQAELVAKRVVVPYSVDGQTYATIRGWTDDDAGGRFRQRLDNASKRTRVPGPEKADATSTQSLAAEPAATRGDSPQLAETRGSRARAPIPIPITITDPEDVGETDIAGATAPVSATVVVDEKVKSSKDGTGWSLVWDRYLEGWRKHVNRGGEPKVTPQITRQIVARMKTFSIEELKRACDGLWASEFLQGGNDRGKRYTGPHLIFKSDEQVTKRLDDAPPPPKKWPAHLDLDRPKPARLTDEQVKAQLAEHAKKSPEAAALVSRLTGTDDYDVDADIAALGRSTTP